MTIQCISKKCLTINQQIDNYLWHSKDQENAQTQLTYNAQADHRHTTCELRQPLKTKKKKMLFLKPSQYLLS